MCGIAGHVCFHDRPDINGIRDLVRRIHHRGPDDFGIWESQDAKCVLGHARLSVIDLSPLGHQPMVDPETGNAIVFNGEIYNYQLQRDKCKAAGDQFRSKSDTEVILALYRRYGFSCLKKLRGMFAFALWDAQRKLLFIARDRVGKKPLNYASVPGGIVFCSEIDPLSRHPSISGDMDLEALELYLQLQYIPAPWTIYKDIRKLPPAHFAVIDQHGMKLQRYWDVDYRNEVSISEAEALEGLEAKLTEAIRLRLVSDVPLGALLSGGVDSSIVVALMAKLAGEPIKTYSIGFRELAFNELPYAQEAARKCGTEHHPEIIDGNITPLLPVMAQHYGEPYADSSALPSFFVCATARRHVTVALNGDGGDELLGGYSRYALGNLQMLASRIVPDAVPIESVIALSSKLATARSLPGKLARKLVTEYAWPEMRSLVMYSSCWNEHDRMRLLGMTQPSGLINRWLALNFSESRMCADTAVERMLHFDNRTYLAGDLLAKMDIASMHCGLETRSPFLDHELIEYCASLPVHLKVRSGVGKYLLKKLAERYFPARFVCRRKMGFGIPLANWLRGPLRETLESVLLDPITLAPLNTEYARRYLDEFLLQRIDHSARLWALLMYGVWRLHTAGNLQLRI